VQCVLWKIMIFFLIFSHKSLDSFLPNIKSQPWKSFRPSIPKELEVMDNFNPDEPIPRSPHVTLWGLRTLIYVLWYLICVLI
jgi:hypothetical protein